MVAHWKDCGRKNLRGQSQRCEQKYIKKLTIDGKDWQEEKPGEARVGTLAVGRVCQGHAQLANSVPIPPGCPLPTLSSSACCCFPSLDPVDLEDQDTRCPLVDYPSRGQEARKGSAGRAGTNQPIVQSEQGMHYTHNTHRHINTHTHTVHS